MTHVPIQSASAMTRRGAATVAVLVMMIVLWLIVMGVVHTGARDQTLSVVRLESVQAYYAAEAGMQMAIRETYCRCDEDLDGVVGTISDDGNDLNDPAIGGGQVVVTQVVAGGTTTRTSAGRVNDARRTISASFK